MDFTLVNKILTTIVENKEKACTFVKNDQYPEGVYRIHYYEFMPKFLDKKDLVSFDIKDYIYWLYEKDENIDFDKNSLWFTIKV